MAAMNIAGPKESIGSATSRPDMPAKIKTALRTLLLSTSDVPGTEGRKRKLRFDGHANNLCFGPPSFFVTPNFADTYSPLVKMLHDGPSKDSHLIIGADGPAAVGTADQSSDADDVEQSDRRPPPLPQGYLSCSAPHMPSLRRMHEIVAADPRAQARFFLLMSELHYRYNIGVERLQIGRSVLVRRSRPAHDAVASSLQPCIAPGTTAVSYTHLRAHET